MCQTILNFCYFLQPLTVSSSLRTKPLKIFCLSFFLTPNARYNLLPSLTFLIFYKDVIIADGLYIGFYQLNSTQRVVTGAGVNTSVRISMTLIYIYVSDITFTDLSPVPVRSAVKSYFTPWSIQNLSRRALNTLTELTSTTWLVKLFQTLTIRAEKNNTFVDHNEIYD